MKNKLIYFLFALSVIISSCDNQLDIKPLNILTSDEVFKTSSGVKAYMASLYTDLPAEDFNWVNQNDGFFLASQTDESVGSYSNELPRIPDGTWYQWWGYNSIRNVNDLMEKLPTAKLSESEKSSLLGEAKFIRAFYYFGLVKRYGGVPIIKKVQNYTGNNLAELQVPRNKEEEVWDFIANDLDSAAILLPEANVSGRATKFAALALKSRAMLYAASIAKYGSVALNGIVGIPTTDAEKYWKSSYDASKSIIDSKKYSLYNKATDKVLNFTQLFIETDNSEAIFKVNYQYPSKGHSYDAFNLPAGMNGPAGYGAEAGPTLELVEQFEYIDGSSGKLKLTNQDGTPKLYANPADLFKDKDPRCMATVIVPFAKYQNSIVDVQAGIYDLGSKVEAGDYGALYNPVTHQADNVNGTIRIVGKAGFGGVNSTQTGFYIRKYMNYNFSNSLAVPGASAQAWIVFRYGEVLLNYAEAAIELNKTDDAKWAVNEIRNRAGIKLLENAEVTLDKIRHERLVELAFENMRWWDYSRWRISDKVLNNTILSSLKPYFDIQANAYRFETGKIGRYPKTFLSKVYYFRIDPAELTRNPKLVQNPGY